MSVEIRDKVNYLKSAIADFGRSLNIAEKKSKINQFQSIMSSSGFWDNHKEASVIIEELKKIKEDVDLWDTLSVKVNEIEDLLPLAGDKEYNKAIKEEIEKVEKDLEKYELRVIFNEKFDESDAIVEINAGAGGTESCDWVAMLFRMYSRWADENNFKLNILDELKGEEAGIKNITFSVKGTRAYGMLKAEKGVHRLVRISPFDSNKRRHTSFASVNAMPILDKEADIEIPPDELKIDTFRASGKGGQHVNVTDSAVRITHIPTGIVAACQSGRSQHQNKQTALIVLRAKLYERREEEKRIEIKSIHEAQKKIEWGSQIRSYVLHPYLMVKDHRTNYETGDAYKVLDGNLNDFINEYLKHNLKNDKKNTD